MSRAGNRYTRQVGRDASTGLFIPLEEARCRRANAVIETISYPHRTCRRNAAGVQTEENQNGFGSPWADDTP